MSNIEIPEEVKANAQRVLDGRENFISSTVELAEFILGLNKPEIKAEPFVIYRIKVRGEDSTYRIGFRVEKDATYSWVSLVLSSDEKENAYPVSIYNVGIHTDDEIEVLERWSPETAQPEFGIGGPNDRLEADREVLVKGVLQSTFADSDGDVRVEMNFADGITASHFVAAKDVAYTGEADSGN